ncbi:MAG TPA: ParB N-terminal domain-containing protein [Thermoplasmata archaeon]|nr:ParB N-terminal domain-containing protein [Thermoplasmata archaeon]
MSSRPRFALVPLDRLKAHEEIVATDIPPLVTLILGRGVLEDPIWVARDTYTILNGHHRVEALRRLGATHVPAWIVDYHGDDVRLDRWSDGPPIAKTEVEHRAATGRLFPPKTTRHQLAAELPPRPTHLAELMADRRTGRGHGRRSSSAGVAAGRGR